MRGSGIGRIAAIVVVAVIAVLVLSFIPAVAVSPHSGGSAAPSAVTSAPKVTAAPTIRTTTTAAARPSGGSGPHPGTLDVYEPTGAGTTVDPAAAYYTVNAEPIWNVYETLIAYNGTQSIPAPSGFVPQVATCVPGSTECQAQFGGNTLVYNNLTTGKPQYYTFEIDSAAHFYDPSTGVGWPVYPSDVVFSFDRTMALANPYGVYNGWINTQDLIPSFAHANSTWDSGIHYPYNNTPNHVLSALLVNDSAYCPTPTVTLAVNGCVTFDVGASNSIWPYFLELVADPMGGSVVSCGVFTSIGAGLPGWLGSSASHGDGPCLLPGNATSTTASSFTNYVATVSPTLWDPLESSTISGYPSPQTAVQWTMIGSGPYYSPPINNGVGYFLYANPDYQVPTGCAGSPGCLPMPGKYASKVNVYWDDDDTLGLQQMIAGFADTAGFDVSHLGTVLQLVNEGKYGLETGIPTLSIFFYIFELNWSLSAEKAIDSTGTINIPPDFFSNVGLRQFIINSYPYNTIENTIFTTDGIQFGEQYGGMIPHNMGNYYPTNISWPTGDPTSSPTTVGNVSWWWNQLVTPSSQWYDPEVASCVSSPCKFPMINFEGAFSVDDAINLEIKNIETFSSNALQPYLLDEPANVIAGSVGLPPGYGNMPFYNYGWAPDYPDPTDYMGPMYGPNATYTFTDAVWQQTNLPAFDNVTACGHTAINWSNLVYWADIGQVPNACQGVAYDEMVGWMTIAATETNIAQRTLDYNLIEHIANTLALYQSLDQSLGSADYGTWIDPATINTNVMIGGGGDQLWFDWGYASNAFNVTFTETGLAAGTTWSATLGTDTLTSTTNTITFTGQTNGTRPYTIGFVGGYGVSPASGTVVTNGTNVGVSVTYKAFTAPQYALTVGESGLVSNTTWSTTVVGVGALTTNQATVTFEVPAANYTYVPGAVVGYSNSGNGNVTVTSSGATVAIVYTPNVYTTYTVTFQESGLPAGASFNVTLNGFTLTGVGSIVFTETPNVYLYTVTPPAGYVSATPTGTFNLTTANIAVPVPFFKVGSTYAVTFTESGLASGTSWSVTLNGVQKSGSTASLAFTVGNGSYSYVVGAVSGYTVAPPSGSFDVSGAPVNVAITYTLITYAVTFFEGGLPTGSNWTVSVTPSGGVPQNITSSTSPIAFSLPNGSYSFTVTGPANYTATPSSGTFSVVGLPIGEGIVFSTTPPSYKVTFTVTGAVTTGYAVLIDGQNLTGTTNTVSISLPNGVYTFAVWAPTGYTASPAAGSITVSGAPVAKGITTAAIPPPPSTTSNSWNYLGTLAYAIIGVLALLAVIFLVLAIMFARRKPPANPPQSWQGTDTKGEGGSQTPPSS